MKMEGT